MSQLETSSANLLGPNPPHNRRSKRMPRLCLAALVVLILAILPAHAQGGPRKQITGTLVEHGLTESRYIPDDICGPRSNLTTFTGRTQVIHVTENPDGVLNIQYLSTGTIHVDFDDPALADQDSQYTETEHYTATPGQTEIYSVTFHDLETPTGIRIWYRVHVTVIDGRVTVDRTLDKVSGCP